MGALLIEIQRRAKNGKGGQPPMGDYPGPETKGDEEDSDPDAIREDAALNLARALGIDEGSVNVRELAAALSDFCQADAMAGRYGGVDKEEADEGGRGGRGEEMSEGE